MQTKFLCTCLLLLCSISIQAQQVIQVGAERMEVYLPTLKDKKIGMVVNQTSLVGAHHLIDTLLSRGVQITAIYAPEHGYRGTTERGKTVADDKDPNTGIPIYSIYGDKKKPLPQVLKNVDLMIFDMQDVGARFFTYISTLHYIMEACAENKLPLLVLDRPNPLGYYVDGPVLDTAYRSFIGMHPIPIVHGMTIGEYAQMINGQGWLKGSVQCKLKVIPVKHYTHHNFYRLPVAPSPNLPDMKSVYLYPSICLFEGTEVSEGRGTYQPFQQFGTPVYTPKTHAFIPKPIAGMSSDPKFEGQLCYGYNLTEKPIEELQHIHRLNLQYLLEFYRKSPDQQHFFQESFDLLAGSDQLRKQIIAGKTEDEIRAGWHSGLEAFKAVRKQYLLYSE